MSILLVKVSKNINFIFYLKHVKEKIVIRVFSYLNFIVVSLFYSKYM
jgi:hypothetical protein